jgi:hypothetical protein
VETRRLLGDSRCRTGSLLYNNFIRTCLKAK